MPKNHVLRVHWGYYMMYAQQPFHHEDYCWDGGVFVTGGRVVRCSLLRLHGPATPCWEKQIPLDRPFWHWHADSARYRFGGVLFEVEGGPEAVVEVRTKAATLRFSIAEITASRQISRHVGFRYSNVDLTAILDGHDPNLDTPEEIAAMTRSDGNWRNFMEADSIQGPVHRWNRTDWVWIGPGSSAEVAFQQPDWTADEPGVSRVVRATFRCNAAVPNRVGDPPEQVDQNGRNTCLQYRVSLNDHHISEGWQPFWEQYRHPMMEEIVVDLPRDLFRAGTNTLRLQSDSGQRDYLLLGRVFLEETERRDLEISLCPSWVGLGEEFEIELLCRRTLRGVRAQLPDGLRSLTELPEELGAGDYRLRVRAEKPLADARLRFSADHVSSDTSIAQVVGSESEAFPMRVGMETCALPWRPPGYLERCLRLLAETGLGNYCVFRKVRDEEHATSLARLCRKLGIHFMMAHVVPPRWTIAAKREGEPFFAGWMLTELDGPLFGYEIAPVKQETPEAARTMRTAHEAYVAFRKGLLALVKKRDPATSVVDMITVLCHSHSYAAGSDLCSAQLNKMHNVLLLADARGAARAYRRPVWGTYIAEGAHKHPEGDDTLRMWWLSIYLAYITGSSFVNDEESLLRNYHERLYSLGDRFPRRRQEILREFHRFVRSHPRRGQPRVKQALLVGRFACDIADGLADSRRQGIPPMVWRFCGANTPEWRPATPEYGLRYLDVFFPGVWLHTLEQSPQRVRRWYSGTPYGELELIPVEAPAEVWSEFQLLMLLGWNSADEQTYRRMAQYVQGGGTLFLGIPHLTTNESRKFLLGDLEPLNLLWNGDFADLLGLRARGKAERLSAVRVLGARDNPLAAGKVYRFAAEDGPSVQPRHPPVCREAVDLAGAEVLACDEATGEPVVARHRVGRGVVYVLLTHEYPGNSFLAPLMTDLIHGLAGQADAPVELEDSSGDVYYTVRQELDSEVRTVHLLNTDWTEARSRRVCRLRLDSEWLPLTVEEGRLSTVVSTPRLTVMVADPRVQVEPSPSGAGWSLDLHGFGQVEIRLRRADGKAISRAEFRGERLGLEADGPWWVARPEFGQSSVGQLTVCEE